VLEFVRPMSLQVESVSITTVVDDAMATIRSLPAAGRTTIAVDRDTQIPRFEGDRLQLRQLFTNLLTNAVEAMRDGGRIWVTFGYAEADEPTEPGEQPDYAGYVTVEVTDDGPGIPEEVTEQMFSPFFTTKPRGTGLGLAIVRKIVNAHDGRIDVGPRAEGGTRFRVRLPVSRLTHVTDTSPSDNRTAGRTHV
jgi:signal transduction histidine kinase